MYTKVTLELHLVLSQIVPNLSRVWQSIFIVIFEFQLHSTHGDAYYIGLNGLEFYDDNGERIGLTEQSNEFLLKQIDEENLVYFK